MIRRSAIIQVSLILTVVAVVTAVSIKVYKNPGAPGGDTFALMSPMFFGMAAKRARGWQKTAVFLALLGLGLSLMAVYAAVTGTAK